MSEQELDWLFTQSLENTLAGLGRELSGHQRGALPWPVSKLVDFARRWLTSRREELCLLLHSNNEIRGFIEGKRAYKVAQIAGIIADFLALKYGQPTAGWMTVALLQLGIEQFCTGTCRDLARTE